MRKMSLFLLLYITVACATNPAYFYVEEANRYIVVYDNTIFLSKYIENIPDNIDRYSWSTHFSWKKHGGTASISFPYPQEQIIYLNDPEQIIKSYPEQDFIVILPDKYRNISKDDLTLTLPIIIDDNKISYLYRGKRRFASRTQITDKHSFVHPKLSVPEKFPKCLYHLSMKKACTAIKIEGEDELIIEMGKDFLLCKPTYCTDPPFSSFKKYPILYKNKNYPGILFVDIECSDAIQSYCDSIFVVLSPFNKVFSSINNERATNCGWIQYDLNNLPNLSSDVFE